MSAFSRFPPRLQQAIVARLGWTALRPVQELAGEAILDGKNAVVLAPTAGGKTEASMFPALANLVERAVEGVGVIYVAPIKALLNNQEERLGTYTEMVGLRRFVWHGDVPERRQAGLREGAGRAPDDDPGVARGDAPLARGSRPRSSSPTCAWWSSTRCTPSPGPSAARTS